MSGFAKPTLSNVKAVTFSETFLRVRTEMSGLVNSSSFLMNRQNCAYRGPNTVNRVHNNSSVKVTTR